MAESKIAAVNGRVDSYVRKNFTTILGYFGVLITAAFNVYGIGFLYMSLKSSPETVTLEIIGFVVSFGIAALMAYATAILIMVTPEGGL